MHRAGYATYLVGKWHLGFLPQYSPMENGFDYFFGFHAGAIDYISHSHDLYENDKPVNVDGYLTDIWAQKTVEIIRQSHQKPFFIALMLNAPHWPWQAPGDKPFADTSGDASSWSKGGSPSIYAAMVKSLDDAVGTIVQTLDEQGLSKNTVVIFTSDNGGERYSDNGIYSGNKMQLLEGGIREPAIVRWPGKIAEHSTSNQAVITMDWTATILSLAGGKADPKFPLDGMNVMPILMQQKKEISRTFYWRLARRAHQKAIVSGYWKYLQDEKGEYLFNLAVDPSEKNDLHQQQPALFQKLKQQYANWEATVLKPGPDLAAKQ
ncbi:MAG: sulfatase-like hydrolase/transferase [Flavisolibacter sp.]